MTLSCEQCQTPVTLPMLTLLGQTLVAKRVICSACEDKGAELRAAQAAEESRHRNRLRFEATCPPEYRDTNVDLLPLRDKTKAVLAWQYCARGLIVSGDTQKGKTRSVWLLLARLVIEEGRTVEAMTAGTFARTVRDAYRGGETATDLFERLTRCDVLFWDDFGKCKMTPIVEDEMLDIVEYRKSHYRPILLTTNGTLETLKAAFSPDRAAPLFERLIASCKAVNFSA